MNTDALPYDALLIVGFGGPEKPEDVMPFLENVTRGRAIPRERLLEVAEHYQHFGGVSPINQQVRDLIAHLEPELRRAGISLPLYWGNRNWTPLLTDTLRDMTRKNVRRALAVVLAAYGSYSSCRQYLENIEAARQAAGPEAPRIDKVRLFYNHPGFVAANAEHLREALAIQTAPDPVHVVFTAHSIPRVMAEGCAYAAQLEETCRLVASEAGIPRERWTLAYQSRSGRPTDPWLEPDILDHLRALHAGGVRSTVIQPLGFLSDHVEVLYDLDEEARTLCDQLGLRMQRARTAGCHPRFVAMLRDLIQERIAAPDLADACAPDCCPSPRRGRP
jgi:ferrochelatase